MQPKVVLFLLSNAQNSDNADSTPPVARFLCVIITGVVAPEVLDGLVDLPVSLEFVLAQRLPLFLGGLSTVFRDELLAPVVNPFFDRLLFRNEPLSERFLALRGSWATLGSDANVSFGEVINQLQEGALLG